MEDAVFGAQSDDRHDRGQHPRSRSHLVTHIFFILFCLEIGLVLFLLPWTYLWDHNYFFQLTPWWREFWLSTYLRGGVSGVGLVNLWIGVAEAWRLWQ